MKLYQYFRIADEEDMELNLHEKYPLYAVTINKTDAKLFEQSRLKGKFLKKVYKGDKKECISYLNAHRGEVLSWSDLRTVRYSDKIEHCIATVLMSDMESDMISVVHDSLSPVFDNNYIDPYIFKKTIRESLEKLGYIGAFILCNLDEVDANWHPIADAMDSIELDELMVFLNNIRDQIDPKGVKEIIRFI